MERFKYNGGNPLFECMLLDSPENLSIALRTNTTLTHLALEGCGLTPEIGVELGAALTENKSLQFLGLYANSIGDVGFKAIAAKMSRNESIRYLSLACNEVTEIGMTRLPELLRSGRLLYLDLGDNLLGDAGAEAVELMEPNHTLVALAMQDCFYGATKAFQRMIKRRFPFTGLKELILRQFSYTESIRGVFHWVLKSPALEVLDLNSKFMRAKRILDDSDAVQELCAALSTNKTLKHLDLDYCGTPHMDSAILLSQMLAYNNSLEYFSIVNDYELEVPIMTTLLSAFDRGGNRRVFNLRLGFAAVVRIDRRAVLNAELSRPRVESSSESSSLSDSPTDVQSSEESSSESSDSVHTDASTSEESSSAVSSPPAHMDETSPNPGGIDDANSVSATLTVESSQSTQAEGLTKSFKKVCISDAPEAARGIDETLPGLVVLQAVMSQPQKKLILLCQHSAT